MTRSWTLGTTPHLARLTAQLDDGHPIASLGIFHCYRTQTIKRVPILDPSLIVILSGEKRLIQGSDKRVGQAGEWLALPAPAEFDLMNVPDARGGRYLALAIPFPRPRLQRFLDHYRESLSPAPPAGALRLVPDLDAWAALDRVVELALQVEHDPVLLEHRLEELLLILLRRFHAYQLLLPVESSWRERVAQVLALDPSRAWALEPVAADLHVSAATLRRRLQAEGCSFRELLQQVRMQRALGLIQNHTIAIGEIAAACGYQSMARFSDSFLRTFGLRPSALRATQACDPLAGAERE